MDSKADKKARDMRRLIWIARISAVLFLAFSLLMVVGYSLNPQGSGPTTIEAFELALFPFGMSVGYLIALRWPLFGGIVSLVCLAAFLVVMQEAALVLIVAFLAIPGVLFVIYGKYLRDQRIKSASD